MSTSPLVGKKVSIGLRYITEMGASEGVVLEETPAGILVQVKKREMFYPWTSVVFVRIDE